MRSFLLRMILPVVFPPRSRFGVLLAMGQILGAAYVQGAAIEAGEQVFTSEVRIDSGVLRGLVVGEKKDVCVYKGIPYAAPPVGERRWKPPQPQAHWEGVRDCFEFGAACPQIVPLLLAAIPEMAINAPMNEDCLYLNIWAPIRHSTDKSRLDRKSKQPTNDAENLFYAVTGLTNSLTFLTRHHHQFALLPV